jgi:hypothetical protein
MLSSVRFTYTAPPFFDGPSHHLYVASARQVRATLVAFA